MVQHPQAVDQNESFLLGGSLNMTVWFFEV